MRVHPRVSVKTGVRPGLAHAEYERLKVSARKALEAEIEGPEGFSGMGRQFSIGRIDFRRMRATNKVAFRAIIRFENTASDVPIRGSCVARGSYDRKLNRLEFLNASQGNPCP